MNCPDCERYKKSAANWRNKAYELNGTPLPWDREELWVGLTEEEINEVLGGDIRDEPSGELRFIRAIEAKLKEKNT